MKKLMLMVALFGNSILASDVAEKRVGQIASFLNENDIDLTLHRIDRILSQYEIDNILKNQQSMKFKLIQEDEDHIRELMNISGYQEKYISNDKLKQALRYQIFTNKFTSEFKDSSKKARTKIFENFINKIENNEVLSFDEKKEIIKLSIENTSKYLNFNKKQVEALGKAIDLNNNFKN